MIVIIVMAVAGCAHNRNSDSDQELAETQQLSRAELEIELYRYREAAKLRTQRFEDLEQTVLAYRGDPNPQTESAMLRAQRQADSAEEECSKLWRSIPESHRPGFRWVYLHRDGRLLIPVDAYADLR
jgi:hypothetical protein